MQGQPRIAYPGFAAIYFDDGHQSGWYHYETWLMRLFGRRLRILQVPGLIRKSVAIDLRQRLKKRDPGITVCVFELFELATG